MFFIQVTPPFKPQVTSDVDTRYFDTEFTGEPVQLTPPEAGLGAIAEENDPLKPYFPQFSFQCAGSTVTGSNLSLSTVCGSLVHH